VLAVASFGPLVLVACASLEGLSGSADHGPDAANEDATTVDAAIEPLRDAAVPLDVNDARAYCKGLDATLCEDFDDSTAPSLFAGWAQAVAPGNALTRVDAGYSAPSALEVEIGAASQTDAGTTLVANLSAALPTVNHARIVYRFFIDTPDRTGAALHLCTVTASSAAAQVNARLTLASGSAKFLGATYPADGGAAIFSNLTAQVLVSEGTWHDVDLSLDFVQQPARVSAKLDGVALAADETLSLVTLGPSPLKLQIGALYAGAPTTGWRVRIDDYAVFTD
jgi:hypothetical protein